ncbi:MAG: deoxyribodipyrimidine photo-lyase [Desulfonatronovibrio sp.]
MRVNPQRIQKIKPGTISHGPVLYWMSRDQRINDNWALIHAQDLALEQGQPLCAVFCLAPHFPGAGLRQYDFMLQGLVECKRAADSINLPFELIKGEPESALPRYLTKIKASCLVMDFDPLKIKTRWRQTVLDRISIPCFMVDAHNIVPCWETSDKQEYAARTIRPKIHRKLGEFLEPFPGLKIMSGPVKRGTFDIRPMIKKLNPDPTAFPVDWARPGPDQALKVLDNFIARKLSVYDEHRNDPNQDALSNLSPYLHFGQISSQTIALRIKSTPKTSMEAIDSFLEELIVRKELSDNFCYYNDNYDNFNGIPDWGKKTLNRHLADQRPYQYSLKQFEGAETHDPLWNAAQKEMVIIGKMHGYLRMYWAKKILEWTEDPVQAVERAVYLNDKYELDGRDPNGYAGILWSMGGLHDRPWKERQIFGMVRYMSYNGCKRKFDVDRYIKSTASLRR